MNTQDLTIKKFREGLANKEFSVSEVVEEYFNQIEEKDSKIGAYLDLYKKEALALAAETKSNSPLAGVPLAIKDNILIEGRVTTAASKILENYKSAFNATVIEKLRENGAIFLGKTNLDEFAMGASTENSAFKKTKNPHDLTRVPGGSSGGSAAAVAGGMALAAVGSDTNGSIRQPASFCGVVGLKPTYGAVSRHGLIALGSSLDVIGPITKTVEDAAIIYEAIRGRDEFDSTSFDKPFRRRKSPDEVRKLKVGVPKEYFIEGVEESIESGVREAIEKLKGEKIEFQEISLPHTKYAVSCYYIILPAEASTNLARYDGVRYSRVLSASGKTALKDVYLKNKGKGFGSESKRRILLGTFVLSAGFYDAYYAKAQKVRSKILQDFDKAFEKVDVILTPTTPTPPFKLGEKVDDPLAMYLADVFTSPSALAGLPAVSIPVKKYEVGSGELPVGFQLIGRHFHEADILDLGQYYEGI